MSRASFRAVRREDRERVIELVRTVLGEFGLEFGVGSGTDGQVQGLPESYTEGGGMFWVAEAADGTLLGTCGIHPVEPADLDLRAFELRKMYLLPTARGLGIGQQLLDMALAFARAQGARCVVLDTIAEMQGATKLYERNGFVRDDGQIRGSRCTRGYRLDL